VFRKPSENHMSLKPKEISLHFMTHGWLQFGGPGLKFLQVRGMFSSLKKIYIKKEGSQSLMLSGHSGLFSGRRSLRNVSFPTHNHLMPRPKMPEALLHYSLHIYTVLITLYVWA
jgi:hypothetical protein